MRNLNELFEGNDRERVWIWLGSDEKLREQFLENCRESNIPTEDIYPGAAVALHRDGAIRYVSMLVWTHTFKFPSDVLKIDYKKFADGEDDYEITKSNLTFMGFQPVSSTVAADSADNKPKANARKKMTYPEKAARLLKAGLTLDEVHAILDDSDSITIV